MAVGYEDHCCDCAVPGYPCRGARCPRRMVKVYFCDQCDPKRKTPLYDDEVYEAEGKDLCEDCLKEMFSKNTED